MSNEGWPVSERSGDRYLPQSPVHSTEPEWRQTEIEMSPECGRSRSEGGRVREWGRVREGGEGESEGGREGGRVREGGREGGREGESE